MPIPLAIMPPFMAYQSLVMGDAFGRAFQFGKRKISAMSNEQFNALTISQMFEEISNEYTRMIPTVEKAMQQSLELQVTIVKELLKTLPAIGQMLNELGINATGKTLDELAHLIGMHFGHDEGGTGTPTPTPTPITCPTGWHWDTGASQCVPDVTVTPTPTNKITRDIWITMPKSETLEYGIARAKEWFSASMVGYGAYTIISVTYLTQKSISENNKSMQFRIIYTQP